MTALPLGIKPGLSGEGFFRAEHMVYPYGVHMALVEVDQETGFLKIHKYLIAYDIGRAINPMLVEGQLVGGMAQGLGGALLEEFAYDGEGQLLTGSFADYLLPSSMEVPPVEIVLDRGCAVAAQSARRQRGRGGRHGRRRRCAGQCGL